jgi:tetratricopeptide (TPR) repeat protein
MPITYNGIGTRYHGHSESENRVAACHSCGRSVSLQSYDTRLWFVILYIPIIPLGRKRIVDECPVCRRHYAVDADEWETRKQLNVSGAMDTYLANPTPEHAMEAHQQMMNFHQTTEAAEFRRQITEKFAQNAKLQAYLGDSLSGKGQGMDATAYYQRALDLRPDLPEARVGVARDHLRYGRLAEARALLDFLEKPGAGQLYSLEPLELLANAYMNAGKREDALALFRCLVSELPAIGQISRFRKKVEACEKALGRKSSLLPKRQFSWKNMFGGGQPKQPGSFRITWRGLAITGSAAAIIFGAILLQNVYRSHHRALYVVNGFKTPATVEVRGVGTIRVAANAEKLDLPEGLHHATITGPIKEELDFEVRSAFWDRLSANSLWLLNVGGSALVTEEHVTYRKDNPPPPTISMHYGSKVERIDRIDHPFISLPPTVSVQSGSESTLRHLDIFRGSPSNVMAYLQLHGRTPEALSMAEWRIKLHPEDTEALVVFATLAEKKHAEDVLRAGLERRPIAMEWHRMYQNLGRSREWDAWVAVEYDGMLKAEPNSSDLLYLRGRVAPDRSEAEQWYTRALQADARNPYPSFALGYVRASSGDWEGARALFARAVELMPEHAQFTDGLFTSRLALEDYDALEKELRATIAKHPLDYLANSRLIDVLLAQQHSAGALKVVAACQEQERKAQIADRSSPASQLLLQCYYSGGDFEKLRRHAEMDGSPVGRHTLFIALVEEGKITEALRIHPLNDPKMKDPWHFLAVSLAWLAASDRDQANAWFRRGVQLLQAGSADEVRAAELLRKDASLSKEKLDAVVLDTKAKAILLAAAGILHPEQRQELFAAARQCNVDRGYPYQLVQRITGNVH